MLSINWQLAFMFTRRDVLEKLCFCGIVEIVHCGINRQKRTRFPMDNTAF